MLFISSHASQFFLISFVGVIFVDASMNFVLLYSIISLFIALSLTMAVTFFPALLPQILSVLVKICDIIFGTAFNSTVV